MFQSTGVFVNVRNILLAGTGEAITSTSGPTVFYTRMAMIFSAPDGNTYRLDFHPDDSVCPGDLACSPDKDPPTYAQLNLPNETSWAKVTFTPATTNSAATWLVDGELTDMPSGALERATLALVKPSGAIVQEGQYSMPFRILITALGPLQ